MKFYGYHLPAITLGRHPLREDISDVDDRHKIHHTGLLAALDKHCAEVVTEALSDEVTYSFFDPGEGDVLIFVLRKFIREDTYVTVFSHQIQSLSTHSVYPYEI